jgi:hypothetical protein
VNAVPMTYSRFHNTKPLDSEVFVLAIIFGAPEGPHCDGIP